MKLKGVWVPGTTYDVGDVVQYANDQTAYILQYPAPAGADPYDTRYWGRTNQIVNDVVGLIMDGLAMLPPVPTNISDDAIVLRDESENEYLVTVDSSGETPELTVTAIEEQGGE